MKVTIIGFRSAYPKAKEAASCYLIQDEGVNIVIDLGSCSLSILQEYINLEDIDGVILTHYHPDHFSDIYCLQHAIMIKFKLGLRKEPLMVYGLKDSKYFNELSYGEYVKAQEISVKKSISIKGLSLNFSKTNHGIDGVAVDVIKDKKRIVYTSDTAFSETISDFCTACNLLITECSLYNHTPEIQGHMDVDDVKALIQRSKANKVILTHLPTYGDNYKMYNEIVKETNENKTIYMATTGLSIEI